MDHENFHAGEREAQERWNSASLWDAARKERLLWDHVPRALHGRLEAAAFFFLATSAPDGRCDCSFKGGGPGLVRFLDTRRFAFPDFDGNGAFMSIGNILLNPHIGCLFIDFTDGARLRVNGRATIHEADATAGLFPAHRRIIHVVVEQAVPNCARHIPRLVPAA